MVDFVVTTLNDEDDGGLLPGRRGDGLSLREAIRLANGSSEPDRISFASNLAGGELVLTQGQLEVRDETSDSSTGVLVLDGSAGTENQRMTINADGESRILLVDGGTYFSTDVSLKNLNFENGFAADRSSYFASGGAVFVYRGSLAVEKSSFLNNISGYAGGALAVAAADLSISSTLIQNNHVLDLENGRGGAIAIDSYGRVSLSDSAIIANFAASAGGGISGGIEGGLSTVDSSLFLENSTNGYGGAIYDLYSPTIRNSLFAQNLASKGGGISSLLYQPTLENVTITGNTATDSGGGVFFGNYFPEDGGGDTGNSIVAGNWAGKGEFDVAGNVFGGNILVSKGSNIFGQNRVFGSKDTDFVGVEADQIFATVADLQDPSGQSTSVLFGVPEDNGGSTLTVALSQDGLAVDAGQNDQLSASQAFDQRGFLFPRVRDGNGDGVAVVDIGAFEFGSGILDFETDSVGNPLMAGDVVQGRGGPFEPLILISSSDLVANPAMIFDSANPSGGARSLDLGTPNRDFGGPGIGAGGGQDQPGENARALGNVLIISADGDSSDPKEAALGGKLTFEFTAPVDLLSVTILDQDDGDRGMPNGEIFAYDQVGHLLATFATEELGDNSVQTLALDVDGVSRLEFAFVGSAAIDELVFGPATPDQDALLA